MRTHADSELGRDLPVVVAIDLGGTKATVALIRADGRLLARSVAPTPRGPAEEAVSGFAARAQALLAGTRAAMQPVAVGLALPAIVDEGGTVSWAAAGVATWLGAAAREYVEHQFRRPAWVQFDGYAATLGEAVYGEGRDTARMAAIIVGTGLGAGLWFDDRVLDGVTGVAGAIGWNRWSIDGSLSGPAESIASGPGILARARELDPGAGYLDTRAVFRAAARGGPAARSAVEQAAAVAGTIAGSIVNLVAPELVVWTGGIGARADFATRASRVARRSCQPFAVSRTRFARSHLGAEASLFGAAAGALQAGGFSGLVEATRKKEVLDGDSGIP
jgi:glucokinase